MLTWGPKLEPLPENISRIVDLTQELGRPGTYDTFYLHLAERESCEHLSLTVKVEFKPTECERRHVIEVIALSADGVSVYADLENGCTAAKEPS